MNLNRRNGLIKRVCLAAALVCTSSSAYAIDIEEPVEVPFATAEIKGTHLRASHKDYDFGVFTYEFTGEGSADIADLIELGDGSSNGFKEYQLTPGTYVGYWAQSVNSGETYYSIDAINPDAVRLVTTRLASGLRDGKVYLGFSDYASGDKYGDVDASPFAMVSISYVPSGSPEASTLVAGSIGLTLLLGQLIRQRRWGRSLRFKNQNAIA